MTSSPEAAPAMVYYLNDRLSLDGCDPSTYGNIAAMFARASAERNKSVCGRVATRSDGFSRHQAGGDAWPAAAASRPMSAVSVPAEVPFDHYSSCEAAF
jgi:deoxyribodipyrimidine photo-lyase